jgi:RNA polymerase sigma-70 factor (ECF subfamily)
MLDEARLADLLRAMAGGDRSAASELYRLIGGRLYGVAQRILRDPGLAEDAVQDGFLKIWKNARRFDAAKGTASAWMATTRACRPAQNTARGRPARAAAS